MKLTEQQILDLKARVRLSDAQVKELQARLSAYSAQADAAVDGWLAKITKSKWSWAIVLGIIAAAWLSGYVL